jgi:hypothetical protein
MGSKKFSREGGDGDALGDSAALILNPAVVDGYMRHEVNNSSRGILGIL